MPMSLEETQREICARFGAPFYGCDLGLKVGVSLNLRSGMRPLNGLRLMPEKGTSGWYLWAGEEWSDDPDFFAPLHGYHLEAWAPIVLPYLGLPPGWRFLVTETYEDVWKDAQLQAPAGQSGTQGG